jgi:3-hydroxyacyl-[acyl-carrier-protein] dehydratase
MQSQGLFMQMSIAGDHPALPGHFPGNPVVPGVVILDHILDAVAAEWPAYRVTGIRKLKYLRKLIPDENFSVKCAALQNGRLRFECLQAGERIAEGNLLLVEATTA